MTRPTVNARFLVCIYPNAKRVVHTVCDRRVLELDKGVYTLFGLDAGMMPEQKFYVGKDGALEVYHTDNENGDAPSVTRALFNSLTAEQKALAKKDFPAFRGLFYVRGKKAKAELEAKGFKMEQCSPQYAIIEFNQSRDLMDMAYEHGPAVSVVRISEHYNDNNGAYEVAHFLDAEGREFTVGNMYDTTACFGNWSHERLIAYVNRDQSTKVQGA